MSKTIGAITEEVLAFYGITGYSPVRLKGGICVIVKPEEKSNKPYRLLIRECSVSEKERTNSFETEENVEPQIPSYEKKANKYAELAMRLETEGILVDAPIKNLQGSYATVLEDETVYTVSKWFTGEECDTGQVAEVLSSIRQLAKLHNAFDNISKTGFFNDYLAEFQIARSLLCEYDRRNRELKKIRNYLYTKKNKIDFERLAAGKIDEFIADGEKALELLRSTDYEKLYGEAIAAHQPIHGDYNYHNCIMCCDYVALCGFENIKSDLYISDLYNFVRKIMEKYDWDVKMGYLLFKEYSYERERSTSELSILGCMFSYPEKFRKIMNFYYGSNKAWFPPKSREKLQKTVSQNRMKNEFVKTLIVS